MQNAKREKELRTLTLTVAGGAGVMLAFAVLLALIGKIALAAIAGAISLLLIAVSVILYVLAERADRDFQREMGEL